MASNYQRMVESTIWKLLEKADVAVFDAQKEFERCGFASDSIYQARLKLGEAQDRLRRAFRDKPPGSTS